MLVLSRKTNEALVIGDAIRVTVIEIRGDKVRLGIEAPRETPVHRREIVVALQQLSTAPDPAPTPPLSNERQTPVVHG